MGYRTENAKTGKRESEIDSGFRYALAFNDGSDDELFGGLSKARFCSNPEVIPRRRLRMNAKRLKPNSRLHCPISITGYVVTDLSKVQIILEKHCHIEAASPEILGVSLSPSGGKKKGKGREGGDGKFKK